jgi:YVTN family beta-propeller protein
LRARILFSSARNGAALLIVTILSLTAITRLAHGQQCAYVTNLGSNSVSVINTTAHAVTTTIAVGNNPDGIAVAPGGRFVYVSNFLSNDVSVVDTTSNTVTTTIPVGTGPVGIAASRDGTFVAVANKGGHSVSLLSPSGRRSATYRLGDDRRDPPDGEPRAPGLPTSASGLTPYSLTGSG